jgi:hypothetical protein
MLATWVREIRHQRKRNSALTYLSFTPGWVDELADIARLARIEACSTYIWFYEAVGSRGDVEGELKVLEIWIQRPVARVCIPALAWI